MKLSFTSLRDMSLHNRSIIICCAALIFMTVFYILICRPKAMAIKDLHGELAQQRTVLLTAQRECGDMPEPAGYYRSLRDEERRVKSLLPDSDAITDLLVTLNTVSKEQNIRIKNIKQGNFADHKNYYEIPLEITITGTYPAMLGFIKKLESLPRFNSITKIGVHAEENLLIMQLAVAVYVYGPAPLTPQAKAK